MSFWLALCTFAWVAFILVVLLSGNITVGILGGLLLLGGSLAGFLREKLMVKAYLLWNRAARKVGRVAEAATLRACYYLVFAPVGRLGGSAFPLRAPTPAASGWVAHDSGRRSNDGGMAGEPFDGSTLASGRGGWVGQLTRGSIGFRRPWMLVLIPYLALLRCYAPSKTDGAVLGNNYTLY